MVSVENEQLEVKQGEWKSMCTSCDRHARSWLVERGFEPLH